MSLRLVVDNTKGEGANSEDISELSTFDIETAFQNWFELPLAPKGASISENDRRAMKRWFGDTNGNR